MAVLLAGSGFFSGSETAFFNLSPRQTMQFRRSSHRMQKIAGTLLLRPKQLLTALLLANMAVNVCYYALGSVLVINLGNDIGAVAGTAAAVLSFALLVMFGEMLPKSFAFQNSAAICTLAALPCYITIKILSPVQKTFNFIIVEPILRLMKIGREKHEEINVSELKLLIEASHDKGLITSHENMILSQVVELGFLKVRHVMQPRVDMEFCNIATTNESTRMLMREKNLRFIAVYENYIDNVKGFVSLRSLLLEPEKPLSELIEDVVYVPEQKTVESLLEFYRANQIKFALVVDEYGGIAGQVTVDHVIDELLGESELPQQTEPIEQIGPMTYRLSGDLPLHDWAETFGIDAEEVRISTIGGLTTALLGKVPKPGDTAKIKNLKLSVESVKRKRIETIILTIEHVADN